MFACLDECSEWGAYEDFSQDHFHYHYHKVYDSARGPAHLRLCEKIFDNDATKGFVQRLSGRDCSGLVRLSASLYLPGDYALPHSDRLGAGSSECRQVAFVWHLTNGWQSNWAETYSGVRPAATWRRSTTACTCSTSRRPVSTS
jgi:Rps23 Pro-64 3,4-dihydroxylase Tpa1-like proline 4-hydroxylase